MRVADIVGLVIWPVSQSRTENAGMSQYAIVRRTLTAMIEALPNAK
jgi:hypothetical protein